MAFYALNRNIFITGGRKILISKSEANLRDMIQITDRIASGLLMIYP